MTYGCSRDTYLCLGTDKKCSRQGQGLDVLKFGVFDCTYMS